ncbi:DUF4435 domain-containing protein [Lysobacter sp. Root690]|uniref:DUF4435 domain-containing protein n=1 Tax=Lysobacter sp. Root690 TaxID=1736588 RepID=UPI0009E7A8F7|nr:DUF4435 domain-containing protein [Lysobacter sp. Root690]
MLQRSAAAKYAKHVFFTSFNDVDIFIEDTAIESKKIYMEIIRRAIGQEVSLAQIFPIGSKSKVLAQCAADQGARERKCVCIIDGDYDVLLGTPKPSLIRLFRLSRYCIENYLIDEQAILSVLDEEVVSMDLSSIRKIFDFSQWVEAVSRHLSKFVVASGVACQRRCGIATVNIPLSELSTCYTGHVDQIKISQKIIDFEVATDAKHGTGIFAADCAQVRRRHSIGDDELTLFFCSGKNLLLPLLKRRLQKSFAITTSSASFKLRVAKRCNIDDFKLLATVIA